MIHLINKARHVCETHLPPYSALLMEQAILVVSSFKSLVQKSIVNGKRFLLVRF